MTDIGEFDNVEQSCAGCGAPNASWWKAVQQWLCNFCGRN